MKFSICYLLIAGMLFAGCSDGTDELPPASFDNVNLIGPSDDSDWSMPVKFVFNPREGEMEVRLFVEMSSSMEFRITDYKSKRVVFDLSGILPRGTHLLTWDGRFENGYYAPPGIYIREIWLGREYWRYVFRITY